eukprot:CFRG2089T1
MLKIFKTRVFGNNAKSNEQMVGRGEHDSIVNMGAPNDRDMKKYANNNSQITVDVSFNSHQVFNIDTDDSSETYQSSGASSLASTPSVSMSRYSSSESYNRRRSVDISKSFTHEYRNSTAATEYTIIRTLNVGSTAKVQLAYHEESDRHVALKIMAKSKHEMKYMNREVSIHKQLNQICKLQNMSHQHIAEIYEVIETPHHFVVVMEYLAGGDLFDLVPPNVGCSEIQALGYLRQITTAVAHLHRSGVVHRDLKPENCVSNGKGIIKLIDYGAATDVTGATTSAGTIPYMAPEMFDKANASSWNLKAIDVWAVGVLFFTLLTGRFPWAVAVEERSPEYKLFVENTLCHRYPWNSISTGSRRIISSALNMNASERLTIDELKTVIEERLYTLQHQVPAMA